MRQRMSGSKTPYESSLHALSANLSKTVFLTTCSLLPGSLTYWRSTDWPSTYRYAYWTADSTTDWTIYRAYYWASDRPDRTIWFVASVTTSYNYKLP